MQVAMVVVDVPVMQTNMAYSYLVPETFQGLLVPGMRVQVPFGKRQVTGFVIDIQDKNSYDGQLKAIKTIIDLKPVLTPELLGLADYMAAKTFSFKISCLQTMIPGGMKAKLVKMVTAKSSQVVNDYPEIFAGQTTVVFDNQHFDNHQTSQILKLKTANLVTVSYELKEAKPTQLVAYKILLSAAEIQSALATIKPNAKGQKRLLTTFLNDPTATILRTQLTELQINAGVIKTALKNNWIEQVQVAKVHNPFTDSVTKTEPLTLNAAQQTAVSTIGEAIVNDHPETYLLQGVTGSGKTEVYLQLIQRALNNQQTALLLVPEITLTPQIVNRIRSRFGDQVAVLHSALSSAERYEEWQLINAGRANVVVGVRSAVFAPLKNLGVVIIDEEHDESYKQIDNPRYHTRDMAKWRAEYNHCPLVLGSATPSLESKARAQKERYQLLTMPERINNQALPEVTTVDMTGQMTTKSGLSTQLADAISARLQRQEQIILLLNKRGYSAFIMCRECGYVPKCPNCDISLTYHKNTNSLDCHYCGYKTMKPNSCPNCHSKHIMNLGMGSEQLQEQVQEQFPTARILRMDVDTTRKKGAHQKIITAFGNQEADILLGTQMIAKGLDFPNVTLVGVLNADMALELPDFRSSERTFQLLTQVAGRAGRADKKGQVIIQTYNPNHYAVQLAKKQDYDTFYEREMQIRKMGKYSPYYFNVKVVVSAPSEKMAVQQSFNILKFLKNNLNPQTIMLGPTPKMIARVNNRYYYQIIIKYRHDPQLFALLNEVLLRSQQLTKQKVQVAIDNEPLNLM